jgi:hypothetical protein
MLAQQAPDLAPDLGLGSLAVSPVDGEILLELGPSW